MIKKLLFLILHLSFGYFYAQDYVVHKINITGTEKIKQDFLFKNIETKVGDTLRFTKIEQDLLSLTALAPVAKTTYQIDTMDNHMVVVWYIIQDAITFIPGITIGNRGDNLWIGAGLSSYNLFRNGQQVSLNYVWVDKQHNVDLFYRIPYLGKTKWSLGAAIYRRGSVEPLFFDQGTYTYKYSIKTLNVAPIYRITPRKSIELPISIFNERYQLQSDSTSIIPIEIPTVASTGKMLLELIYRTDNIKYNYFLLDGMANSTTIQWVNTFGVKGEFYSITNILRKFIMLGKTTNIATRLKIGLASNGDSPFAPFVLDNDANIRGIGSRVQRGTGELLANIELRQTLFTFYSFAGQFVAFTDIGSWRIPGGSLTNFFEKDLIKLHAGAGLRFIYTRGHNYILRIDYGFNPFKNTKSTNGFVVGIGQYF